MVFYSEAGVPSAATCELRAGPPSYFRRPFLCEGRIGFGATPKRGVVKCWFNGERGYGFIRPVDGGEAIFVHHTCVVASYAKANSLSKGALVTYEVVRRKMGGPWAKDVCRAD